MFGLLIKGLMRMRGSMYADESRTENTRNCVLLFMP